MSFLGFDLTLVRRVLFLFLDNIPFGIIFTYRNSRSFLFDAAPLGDAFRRFP